MRKKIVRKNLLWVDLEMSGLNPDSDVILEIASIITNDELEVLGEGPDLVIGHEKFVLDRMDEWCTRVHEKSGLCKKVMLSDVSLEEAEELTLNFVTEFFKKDEAVLAGNSVWNDRAFIRRHMPRLDAYLNYRIVDVSSVKELVRRWYPESPFTDFKKHETHRALVDIKESIAELKHYRTHFFIPKEFTQSHETE